MKILLVSNMYPDKKNQSYGTFVKIFHEQVLELGIDVEKSVMKKSENKIMKKINYLMFYFITFIKIVCKKYDCIYIHYASHSSLPVIYARKFKKIKIYTNLHGSDVIPENANHEKMQKYTEHILKISEKIVVPSQYFADLAAQKYEIEKNKIYVYPSGGVDNKKFYPYTREEKQKLRKKYNIAGDKIVFGYVGRISEGKGWSTYLRAIKEYVDTDNEGQFILLGSGNQENEMNAMIEELELQDIIVRLSLVPQEQLVEIYNLLDVFVFPTERAGESLGLVALEAMACGVPVIASDFAAPRDYIIDGVNGYKFEKGNWQQLESNMREVQDVSDMRPRVIKSVQQYGVQTTREQLNEIFENTHGN